MSKTRSRAQGEALKAAVYAIGRNQFKLDALPDPADFRDYVFISTLADIPVYRELEAYQEAGVPVLNQGNEGSCTGFALATVAHYLLRTRQVIPSDDQVSPRMFYEMAKRYDEWEGVTYEGSSARGAMKGWHKHGVCSETLWPYQAYGEDRALTAERTRDALSRTLGAYYRIDRRDLTAMHSALAEVGILFASARIHEGWNAPHPQTGRINLADQISGGHAFAIVGYNRQGFWVQSSWGEEWGKGGFALLTYDDWLVNGMDVWVARLGVPVDVNRPRAQAEFFPYDEHDVRALGLDRVRSHIVRVNTQGNLSHHGSYATFRDDVERIFDEAIPEQTKGWATRRLLIYAGGGLTSEDETVTRMMFTGARLLGQEIYPLAFIWNTDSLPVLDTIINAAYGRLKPEHIHPQPEFFQQRLDYALEPLTREQAGLLYWRTIKEYGHLATRNEESAVRIVLANLQRFLDAYPDTEIHLLTHSAGSIFLAPMVQYMTAPTDRPIEEGPMADRRRTGLGMTLKSCTLWAPAIRTDLFKATYLPPIESGQIERFTLYTLSDEVERNDCTMAPYSKSLLYLISNALEDISYVPLRRDDGQPLTGMEKFVRSEPWLHDLFQRENCEWVLSPNDYDPKSERAARSQSHVHFEEEVTFHSTVLRILNSA